MGRYICERFYRRISRLMITLFTTTKNFTGRNAVNQLNALRSWKALDNGMEIIIFGVCDGIDDISRELGIVHFDEVETSDAGVPLIRSMFETVSDCATYEICCFVNADIILPGNFIGDVSSIHSALGRDYLIVGQRNDVDVDKLFSFDAQWEHRFQLEYGASLCEHPPQGSDYFVFPKGQYLQGHMPTLLVGRPGWDLWMIYNARSRGYKTIDLSFSTRVIHQNHDYGHKHKIYNELSDDPEAKINLAHLPKKGRFIFTLLACNYLYRDGELCRNYSRGDLRNYRKIERILGRSPRQWF